MREVNEYGFFRSSSKGGIVQELPYLITQENGSANWYSPYYYVTTGSSWYYDFEFSKKAGCQFYIGIERFAHSGSTSNNSCTYQTTDKANTLDHKRIQGTINLNTPISTGPVERIRFRVLSNWTGTTQSGSAEVYRLPLKELSSTENIKNIITFNKRGVVYGAYLERGDQVLPEKYGDIAAGSFVEY